MRYEELQQAADQARAAYQSQQAITLYAEALAALGAAPDAARAFEILAAQASCYHRLAEYAAEEQNLAALEVLATQLGDRRRQVAVLLRRVELLTQTGAAAQGRQLGEAALAQALGDAQLEADCRYTLGRACAVLGDHAQAQANHERALELYRALGDRSGEAHSLRELGWGASRFSSQAEGQHLLEQALALYRALGDREGEAMALNELSTATGDYARQRAYLEQALTIVEALGDQHKLCILANNLGLVYLLLGLYRQASTYCERAVRLARSLQAQSSLAFCLDTLAHAYLGLGALEAADHTYAECRDLTAATGMALEAAYAALGLGRVALRRGTALEAYHNLQAAAQQLATLGASGEQATALAWLASSCLALGNLAEAEQHSAQAVALLEAGVGSRDFPPQDVWWLRYEVLNAQAALPARPGAAVEHEQHPGDGAALGCLDRAQALVLDGIASLSDAGLRRNYLNKVAINRQIVEQRLRLDERAGSRAGLELAALPDNPRDQLTRMLAISVQMNERRDQDALHAFILDQIVELSGAERALLLIEGEGSAQALRYGMAMTLPPQADALLEAAARTRQATLQHSLVDAGNEPLALRERSALAIPLIAAGQLVGRLYADTRTVFSGFASADLDLLTVLATQAATALENARLYGETLRANRELEQRVAARTVELERRLGELATVNQIGQAVARQLELGALIELVGETMRSTFDAQNVYVALYDRERELISFPYDLENEQRISGDLLRFGVGLTSEILLTRQPLLINDATDRRAAGLHIALVGAPTRSFLGVPILVGEEAIGVISVQNTERDDAFSAADVRLLSTIAASVGVAISNARLYAERIRMQQAAEAASVAKSSFLANMSHELRTPLNAVLGFAQVLARDETLAARNREHLGIITRSGEHLLQLINNVLEMSKVEAGRVALSLAPFDLPALIRGVAELFVLRAEAKQLRLDCVLTADMPANVIGDEGKLRQVLINILGNAIKFTQQGSVQLRVSTAAPTLPASARILFEVEDSGEGIAPDQLDKLFQPFVQTASGLRAQEGSGLGLAISRQFVQLMGGDIGVASEPGQGTRFWFTLDLPLASETGHGATLPERRPTSIVAEDQRVYRVLVADDKWENRQLLREWLGAVGIEVREAADGQEALVIWEHWAPDLIWMDLRMPVLDGYEATRRIKRSPRGQATVVIALTASTFEQEQAVMLATGCDDFVRKPVREATIFQKLEQHLGMRFVYAETSPAPQPEANAASAAAIRALPAALRTALQQAVDEVDAEALAALLTEVQRHDAQLAEGMQALLAGYRFDLLQQLCAEE